MTDTMKMYRHEQIANLLVIAWACNDADSDNPPAWTTPAMAGNVVTSCFNAIRGLLDGDDLTKEGVEEVVDLLIDNQASIFYEVTSAVDYVSAQA